ncbi:MAG: cystathionine beta-synthase, partial [Bacteroidetes bacterium]|nr:cystathionine beta-synthase [Bacteroidota bacterium]
MARLAARKEGWMVGSSSGAVIAGGLRFAEMMDEDAVIVMLLPDSGKNYLSTIFNDEWMRENGLL